MSWRTDSPRTRSWTWSDCLARCWDLKIVASAAGRWRRTLKLLEGLRPDWTFSADWATLLLGWVEVEVRGEGPGCVSV